MISPTLEKYINNQLRSRYGISTDDRKPIWRLVWSNNQIEKRKSRFTPEGIELLHPRVMEFKKYEIIGVVDKWVLERLVLVPEIQQDELDAKVSYEPMWVFQDKDGNALPPFLDACLLIVDTVYATQGKKSLNHYVEEQKMNSQEEKDRRVNELYEQLFGNETSVGDALAHKSGVTVSGPKQENNNVQ